MKCETPADLLPFEAIARICHEANRVYCRSLGDMSQVMWEVAPPWQRESALMGVQHVATNPDAGPGAAHMSWYAQKEKEGWTYGAAKDAVSKTHPCMVPYDELPEAQKKKDRLFIAVCKALL